MIAYLVKLMRELTQNITKERASKLDKLSNLDRSLSGVENNIGRKIDNLASSSQGSNPNIALGNLSNKIDALKQDVDTKSSQVTVNKVGQDLNNIASTIISKIGTVESKVNQTNTTLATKANQNTVDAVASNVNSVLALARQGATKQDVGAVSAAVLGLANGLDRSVIKRIQRGHMSVDDIIDTAVDLGGNSFGANITLPYSVDMNKSFIVAEFSSPVGVGDIVGSGVVGIFLNNRQIQLQFNSVLRASGDLRALRRMTKLGYQVLEFN